MKIFLISILFVATFNCTLFAQTRTIRGRVVSEFFEPLPGVSIFIKDSVNVGKTNLDGYFDIDISVSEKKICLASLGLESTKINLVDGCDDIEVIMMLSSSYDFYSLKKIEKLRKKRFKKISSIHNQAFKKGLFKTETSCYSQEFNTFYQK